MISRLVLSTMMGITFLLMAFQARAETNDERIAAEKKARDAASAHFIEVDDKVTNARLSGSSNLQKLEIEKIAAFKNYELLRDVYDKDMAIITKDQEGTGEDDVADETDGYQHVMLHMGQ